MKIQELRIGNYIQRNGIACTVELINGETDDVYFLGKDFYSNSNVRYIEPIYLNKDWLFKFGFKIYEFDNKANQFRFKDRLIVYRDGFLYDYGTSVKLEFVHQLQNLYFALTGAELTCEKETK